MLAKAYLLIFLNFIFLKKERFIKCSLWLKGKVIQQKRQHSKSFYIEDNKG